MANITTDIQACAQALRAGELVAFGTETVYGLGANALDPQAVARIFAAKQRPEFDPLIVHVADAAQVDELAEVRSPILMDLMQRFWPGPLTLLLPKRDCIPDLVTSGLPEVGLRIPRHPLALELIRQAGVPVAAPSANLFGRISPTTAQHVQEQLGDRIDWILDGGPCSVGVESTVLRVDERGYGTVLRPGGVTLEELRFVLPNVTLAPGHLESKASASPGQLLKHYAPRKPLQLVTDWTTIAIPESCAALAFQQQPPGNFVDIEVLSPAGSLTEAAANFFRALRRLDAGPAHVILAEEFPETGLGIALNDRLRRAAAGSGEPSDW
ncbi:MAG: threonylcarbamoyl-AMP synthase [Planctomycetaceae bacterium]|nr:threonylcarbamoyl-AMP synthase [Planctomycetaceae bacterium]